MLMSFPRDIVDRTLFLEGKVLANPAYEIVKIIKKLQACGAEVVGIACNTSHVPAIFDVIEAELNRFDSGVMLINMPLEVCNFISEHHPDVFRVGLMTTNGMYKSRLYKTMLQERGYEVVIPDPGVQADVIHRMIYDPVVGIKGNATGVSKEARALCQEAISFFKAHNVQAIVLGCTELSLVLNSDEIEGMLLIDSTKCMAKALIREALVDKMADVNSLKMY
jgi:aspartate racemase